ncbi:MAG: lipoyl(octanoyl) transferase LipB [Methylococcaceae bacterium]
MATPVTDRILHPVYLGIRDYEKTLHAMRHYTETRQPDAPDELWLLQHPTVYTLGLNGNPEHLLKPSSIPLIKTDRGGQITCHGPGQLVAYPLLDLKRNGLGVRQLVSGLERSVIGLLKQYGIAGETRRDAPGVYVEGRKLASLGLRVRRGCSYHGLSLNVNNDLTPFAATNPCGYAGLEVISLAQLGIETRPEQVVSAWLAQFLDVLGYRLSGTSPVLHHFNSLSTHLTGT